MSLQNLSTGNLVYIPKTKQFAEITVTSNILGVQVNNNIFVTLTYNEIKPIKLTKRMLLRFGFKEVSDHFENENCWIYLFKNHFEYEHIFSKSKNTVCYGRVNLHRKYYYVHELQNLYSAIEKQKLLYK